MIIAVNTLCLLKDDADECTNFLNEVFTRMARLHKEHTFIFILNEALDPLRVFPINIIPVITTPGGDELIKLLLWFNTKIPVLLKKYKADVFISPGFCSFITKVPQCVILNDFSFLELSSSISKNQLLLKKIISQSLKKASSLITTSEYSRSYVIKKYKISQEKIQVIHVSASEDIMHITNQEKESMKEKYADRNEYFIYAGEINPGRNLLNLLKAFSAFKKRQKSNMRLLIVTYKGKQYEDFLTNLNLFKYKSEVNIFTELPLAEKKKIISSAYAMVYPSLYIDSGSALIDSMKYEVPVITSSTGDMPEICGDAALYADPQNFKDIAIKMMTLFKDEKLRATLIEKGKLQSQKYCWDVSAGLMWDNIENTIAIK